MSQQKLCDVELCSYTQDAERILIAAKHTRRLEKHDKGAPIDQQELQHCLKTVLAPLEFVDYIFLIKGVTRAFTHQLVRSRVGTSFAQESMRVANKSGQASARIQSEKPQFKTAVEVSFACYESMIEEGVATEDARGVLPINTLTNIMMKINLRALSSMMNSRLCVRTAKEYRTVAEDIRDLVLNIHPWAEPVLRPYCAHHGVCCYPAYTKCPLKAKYQELQPVDTELDEIMEEWKRLVPNNAFNPIS